MAVEFRIKQANDKDGLTVPQIAALENLSWGAMDRDFCLEFDKVGQITVMYSENRIGRGFELWLEKDEVVMRMPLPNTENDIRAAYSLAKKLCEYYGADSFLCDEEIVPFEHINVKIGQNIAASENAIQAMENQIKDGTQKSFILFGATNPITFGERETAEMGGTLEGFEKLMHRLQSMEVAYSNARYYQMKDGTVFGLFIVREGVMTVLPKVPVSLMGPIEQLKGYYVHLPDDNDVPYEVFRENVVPAGEYDSGHVMVCLTDRNITYLAENCTVAIDTGNSRKGVYWGRVLDNGRNHEGKIASMELAAEEYSGYNHLAVFLRWAAEKNMLSSKLTEAVPNIMEIVADGRADLRRIIANHPAFGGRLRSFHFRSDCQRFAKSFYVFGKQGYPNCVDEYAEKRLGSERYNCVEYKNEAYLFVPYDDEYYRGLSEYIEKAWKKFNR